VAVGLAGFCSGVSAADRMSAPPGADEKKTQYDLSANPFFLPEGRNLGDTFPLYKDGTWHLFCMWMPRFGHFASRDLVHWEKRPETPFGGATGTVIEHAGKFYMFFTGGGQTVHLATSDDLDRWALHPNNPVLDGDDQRYERRNFRDPFVFFNEEEGQWWLLIGTRQMHQPGQRAGCVGLAKSKDLLHWELAEPLWAPQIGPHTDCPQVIRHRGKWYLIYLQRHTRYRVADSLAGPWRRPPIRDLGSRMAAAGSRPASDGKRWISFPFVVTPKEPHELAPWGYGGPLAVPRQWDLLDNGTISLRPADEIVQAMHALPANPHGPLQGAEQLIGRWKLTGGHTAHSENPSGGTLLLKDVPANAYFETEVTLDTEDTEAHVLLSADPGLTRGYQLSLCPRTDLVRLRAISYWDTDRVLEAVSLSLEPQRPIKLRIFRSGTILDVFIDDRTTLTHRLYQYHEGHWLLEFRDGGGTFSSMKIRRLESPR
jgi:beta-fructofuranosidase